MSNPDAEYKQAQAMERIAVALERIAQGVERYAAADPMTVLHEAMQGADQDGISAMGDLDTVNMPNNQEPREPISANGFTAVYRLPGTSEWQIVARRSNIYESGYVASIERAAE